MLTRLTTQSSTGLPLRIGIATYSLRMVPTDQAIAVCKRLGIETCSIKDVHLPRKSTAAERKAGYQKWMDAGITPLSVGNIALPDNEEAIRDAFVYCKDIGVPTMVCTPEIASLPLLDRLSQEYAINIAIHNHGPEDKKFGDPDIVMGHIGKMNPRMGLCVDIGHAARNGKNPAEQIRKYRERVYDVHFKDVKAGAKGMAVGSAIEVGRGSLDIAGIFKALIDIRFTGNIGIEYEKSDTEPIVGLADSVGFMRGTLAQLRKR